MKAVRIGLVIVLAGACASSTPRPSRVDETFTRYSARLPEPATLSESNGASLECAPGRWQTYTHLYALAKQLPIERDDDLLTLVRWAHGADPCIRDIAMEAIVERIGYDRNRLAAPGMHTPDDHIFHELLVALRAYLVARHVAIPAATFDGMFVDIAPADLATFRGSWEEDVGDRKNFKRLVQLDAGALRVITRHVTPDPAWPDSVDTAPIANVTVNARGAFVIGSYSLMPVSRDVIGIDDGNEGWDQLRRH